MSKPKLQKRYRRHVAGSIYDLIHYETLTMKSPLVTSGQIAKLSREAA